MESSLRKSLLDENAIKPAADFILKPLLHEFPDFLTPFIPQIVEELAFSLSYKNDSISLTLLRFVPRNPNSDGEYANPGTINIFPSHI